MNFASSKVYTPRAPLKRSEFHLPKPIPNTNIISIDLGKLSNQVKLFTGDPKVCRYCEAIFNSTSVICPEGEKKIWKCEFCEHVNTIDLEEDEIPSKEETLDYMLLPPEEKKFSDEQKVIIFCLDTSGSMCVTTEIVGKLKIRGDKNQELSKSLNHEALDQWLPRQRRDVTYVSRLQCVQAAMDAQLEKLKQEHPNYKVGLVVFNHEVTILGDGTIPPLVITGDKLSDYDTLLNIGTSHQIVKPIGHCKEQLVKKLYELDECGATALGPALVVALGMTQSSPGSTIVLATDGLANTGIGTLDPPSVLPTSTIFYDQLTQSAKEKSVSVNILGIRGDSINVNVIGRIADGTSGIIDLVDPEKITENFATIFASRLVGTNVSVKLFLHNGFQFPEDEEWNKGEGNTFYVVRKVGNAFEDTEITAEFKLKSLDEISEIFTAEEKSPTGKTKNSKKELPFQVQIEYTAPSGMKCLRVITRKREITTDQSEVLKNVDVALLGMHANNTSAKLAQRGDVLGAMKSAESYGNLIQTNVITEADKKGFERWSLVNKDLYSSPQIQAQQRYQEQQQVSAPWQGPFLSPQPPLNSGNKRSSSVSSFPPPSTVPQGPSLKSPRRSVVGNVGPSLGFQTQTQPAQQPQQYQSSFTFGQPQPQQSSTNSFTFGQPQPQQSSTNSFTFGQPQPQQSPTISSFNFGQPQPQQSSTNSFTFGQPQPQQSSTSSFNFGQPQPQQSSTINFNFGQPQLQQSPTRPQEPLKFAFSSNVAEPSLLPASPPQPQTSNLDPFQSPPSLQPYPQQPTFLPPQSPGILPQLLPPQSPLSPQSPLPQYDDDTSNQIYQQKNIRKNKNLWSDNRKY